MMFRAHWSLLFIIVSSKRRLCGFVPRFISSPIIRLFTVVRRSPSRFFIAQPIMMFELVMMFELPERVREKEGEGEEEGQRERERERDGGKEGEREGKGNAERERQRQREKGPTCRRRGPRTHSRRTAGRGLAGCSAAAPAR